jgi:TetR/AcrR family transcriptional repressor of nem operon
MGRIRPPSPAAPAPPVRGRSRPDTRDRVLDAAERLAQTVGFNGFSYADVAKEVGITTASLHYHFPGKAELGRALIERYDRVFRAALEGIEGRERTARGRLAAYAGLYAAVLARERMCLCGMLAAEISTLPAGMQRGIRAFFEANEGWLARILDAGRAARELAFAGTPRDAARHGVSTLEGAMLLARSHRDPARFATAARRLLADFAGR